MNKVSKVIPSKNQTLMSFLAEVHTFAAYHNIEVKAEYNSIVHTVSKFTDIVMMYNYWYS